MFAVIIEAGDIRYRNGMAWKWHQSPVWKTVRDSSCDLEERVWKLFQHRGRINRRNRIGPRGERRSYSRHLRRDLEKNPRSAVRRPGTDSPLSCGPGQRAPGIVESPDTENGPNMSSGKGGEYYPLPACREATDGLSNVIRPSLFPPPLVTHEPNT